MIETPRLYLIPATEMHLRAELESLAAISQALGVEVPRTWPPELYDEDGVCYNLARVLEHPAQAGWGFYYVVRHPVGSAPPLLIGGGGFKGAPDNAGSVEIGYSIVSEHQRCGYATEAVRAWVQFAFASPDVHLVVGQTLPHLIPSIGVLEKAGFRFAGEGEDPHVPAGERVVRYELAREGFMGAPGFR